jgi:uncharacterized protein (TIGR02246 family)
MERGMMAQLFLKGLNRPIRWKSWMLILMSLFGLCLNAAHAQQIPDKSPDVDREVRRSIDQGNQQYITAFKHRDAVGAADVYDERGSRLYAKGVVIRGRTAITADLERFFKQSGQVSVTLETLDLWVTDDLAYETGKWSYTFKSQGQDQKTIGGRHVRVWKKQRDGTWKILAGMGLTAD